MKTYPEGYFTDPIYKPTTWPPGFVPTLFKTWGHKAAQASMVASENRERRVAKGCMHSLGSIDLPGTPTSPAPKNEGRPWGFVTDRITALLTRPKGATCLEISAALGITPDQASKRLSRLAGEQRRKGLTPVTSQRTGQGNTLRYRILVEDDEP